MTSNILALWPSGEFTGHMDDPLQLTPVFIVQVTKPCSDTV